MKKKLVGIIALFFVLQFSFAQIQSIQGNVVDEAGLPLMGVTVLVKGTNMGTQTNLKGNYTIKAKVRQTLVFSFIGMTSVEKKVTKNSSRINVTLSPNTEELEEVVVTTGYQDIKKDQMTGSVAVITAKDIKNLNLRTVDQILQGRVAGVSSFSSGRPGAEATVHIRGINSLTGNTQPIWIVDGLPLQGEAPDTSRLGGNISKDLFQGGLGNLSPDDIESITVLKDAAASAIYGARAANGVIVIKTKQGVAGKPRYHLTLNTGVSARPVNNLPMMNSKQKIEFERILYEDSNDIYGGRITYLLSKMKEGKITPAEAEAEINRLGNINTNWFNELYKPGFSSQINASMSGGNEYTRYYNSINFLNEEGTEYNNKYSRLRVNTKFDHSFNDKVKIYGQLSATYKRDQRTAAYFKIFNYALYANPYETPDGYDMSYDMSRSQIREGFEWQTFNAKNEIMNNTYLSRYLDAGLTAKIEWKPLEGLTLSSQGAIYANSVNNRTIEGENTYTNYKNNWLEKLISEVSPEQVLGSLKEGTSYGNNYNLRNSIAYTKDFNEKHHLDLFLGQELSSELSYGSFNFSPIFDQVHRIVGFPELPKGTDMKKINQKYNDLGGTSKLESRLVSFFMNGTYGYDSRYVISSSIRYDGSDIIGNKNQFTPLWNTSARWNIHNEKFLSDVSFIDELSLRAGYGFTGSIDKNAFPFIVMKIGDRYVYDGMVVPEEFSYSNPNVRWQTKKDLNLGLDLAMLKGRLQFRVNYYNNFVFDLLDYKKIPLSSGRSFVIENVANLVNKGWEIEAAFSPVFKDKVQWNIRANVSINDNKITTTRYKTLGDIPNRITKKVLKETDYFIEGYSVNSWYGYRFAGVNPENGHTMVYNDEGEEFDMDLLRNVTLNLKAPTPSYIGKLYPPIVGGFSTDLNWHRWVFSMSFEFKLGNMIPSMETYLIVDGNHLASDVHHWRSPGDMAKLPVYGTDDKAYLVYVYDINFEKGDYLRNTYCSIGYNLPEGATKALGCKYARFTLSGDNLFTLTNYRGLDPSQLGKINYPNSRRYNITLNFGF